MARVMVTIMVAVTIMVVAVTIMVVAVTIMVVAAIGAPGVRIETTTCTSGSHAMSGP